MLLMLGVNVKTGLKPCKQLIEAFLWHCGAVSEMHLNVLTITM